MTPTSIKTTLFNSTLGFLKITVESVGTTLKNGTYINSSYIGQNGVMNLNPSTYLVFSYTEANAYKSIYMSFPHIYRLREIFENLKDMVLGYNNAFDEIDGVFAVNPQYAEPIVYANIGKKKQWISFTPSTIAKEDGIGNERGISIQISGNDNSSLLNADEIVTIYSIIKDLNLPAFHFQAGVVFVMSANGSQPNQMQYPPQQYQPQYVPQPQYQQQYQSTVPQAPRAGVRTSTTSTPPANQPRYNNQPQQQRFSRSSGSGVQNIPQQSQMPPRDNSGAGILSPQSIEDVPVEEISFDNIDVNDIFNSDN